MSKGFLLVPFMVCCFLVSGCKQPAVPVLPDASPTVVSDTQTVYMRALQDMGLLLDVYYPPLNEPIYYYVKPIHDATNLSATGEIPADIGDLVRSAFGDIHDKIRVLDHITGEDVQQTALAAGNATVATYIIGGSISQYDRALESTSSSPSVMGSFGRGHGAVDFNGSMKDSKGKSHIGVTLRLLDSKGVSLPGRFGGEMDLWHGQEGFDIGFAIVGIGFGYACESTAVQGRHQALRLISDLSVVQIVGRSLALPYWRTPVEQSRYGKIYDEDHQVLRAWEKDYKAEVAALVSGAPSPLGMPIIASMQAACIANGDNSVTVNNNPMDPAFRAAIERFAERYDVKQVFLQNYPQIPSFEMYKALELNRILDVRVAEDAWSAFGYWMQHGSAPAKPKPATVKAAQTSSPSGASKSSKTKQASPDYDKMFEDF